MGSTTSGIALRRFRTGSPSCAGSVTVRVSSSLTRAFWPDLEHAAYRIFHRLSGLLHFSSFKNAIGPSAPVELKVDFLCGNNEVAGRRLHHCVVAERNVEGKNNKKYEFTAEDCTDGLPQGKCIASVLAGSEVNMGEKTSTVERTDFTAYAPNDEYKGKTGAAWVRWFNANAKPSLSRMSVAVDYLCEN